MKPASAGFLCFGEVAAQPRTRLEDESHCRQNGGIPERLAGRAYKDMTRSAEQIALAAASS
ncbi:hypothetical protein [Vibrio ruber]|uniref:hypothetical protein n=1 Tax=Vibrio ruber TaxID=184755 RepID=UPI0013966A31|nr:hypothetical protein [Vibrio ruber]